jgi:hypothetical protein
MKITKDIQYVKINKKVNEIFRKNNQEIYKQYLDANKISEFQYKALLANDSKIELALKHPMVLFKEEDQYLCITETSQQEGNIRMILSNEQILEGDKSIYHKAEILKIKEFDGKYYVWAL